MQSQYLFDPIAALMLNVVASFILDSLILYIIYRKYHFGIGFKIAFLFMLSLIISNISNTLSRFYEYDAGSRSILQVFFALINILIMIFTLFYILKNIVDPINTLVDASETISEGNLITSLPEIKTKDETFRLRNSFEKMNKYITSVIIELQKTTTIMTCSSRVLATSSDDVNA